MRMNYSANELKGILNKSKRAVGGRTITGLEIETISPFKEKPSEVSNVDSIHGGR